MKSKAPFDASRPAVMPTIASGTVSQMISGWRILPNSRMLVRIISRKPTGSDGPSPDWACLESSYSPPQDRLYPGGRSMASICERRRWNSGPAKAPLGLWIR